MNDNDPSIPTSITQIPVMNKEINKKVATQFKMKVPEIESIMDFTHKFIGATLMRGQLEGVAIGYFGTWKPKKERVMSQRNKLDEYNNGLSQLKKIIRGEQLDTPIIPGTLNLPSNEPFLDIDEIEI